MKESIKERKIRRKENLCILGVPALLYILKYYNYLGPWQETDNLTLIVYGIIVGLFLSFLIPKIIPDKGREFERVLAVLFAENGYKVEQPSKGKDYGADLIIERGGIRKAVQIKYREKKNVGVNAVKDAYAAKKYYKASQGVVITNQDFTKESKNLAKETNVILLRGVDYKGVIESKQV